jgi:hypothetical protein
VTADGGLTIPPAVLDRMAADALLANRERLASYAPLIAEIDTLPEPERGYAAAEFAVAVLAPAGTGSDTLRRMDEAIEACAAARTPEVPARGGLRLVPPPGPVQPATPCPPWCVVEHQDASDRFHFDRSDVAGPVSYGVEVGQDDIPSVMISFGSDPEHLDLDEVDALIAGLIERRSVLAALVAERAPLSISQRPTGGAA